MQASSFTIGIIHNNASQQALLISILKTKILETTEAIATDTSIVAPIQEAALMIIMNIMIKGIITTSKPLATSKATTIKLITGDSLLLVLAVVLNPTLANHLERMLCITGTVTVTAISHLCCIGNDLILLPNAKHLCLCLQNSPHSWSQNG